MEEMQYERMTDESVVKLSQEGDSAATEYLLNKYKALVSLKCRPYYLVGADRDDVTQEGMIGLYKALREYDPARCTAFIQYAELCIQNQVMSAIRATSRQKHIPLNYYVSLSTPVYEEADGETLMDTLVEQKNVDPMELIIGKENLNNIESHLMPQLSPLEREVFYAYVEGKTYREIAKMMGRTPKSIDNTIQRLKFKLEDVLKAIGIILESASADARRAQIREHRREAVRANAREHAKNIKGRHGRKLTGESNLRRKPGREQDGSDMPKA